MPSTFFSPLAATTTIRSVIVELCSFQTCVCRTWKIDEPRLSELTSRNVRAPIGCPPPRSLSPMTSISGYVTRTIMTSVISCQSVGRPVGRSVFSRLKTSVCVDCAKAHTSAYASTSCFTSASRSVGRSYGGRRHLIANCYRRTKIRPATTSAPARWRVRGREKGKKGELKRDEGTELILIRPAIRRTRLLPISWNKFHTRSYFRRS